MIDMSGKPVIFLIPSLLSDDNINVLPASNLEAIKECSVLFVENERTTRRFLKKIWKEIDIDSYEWFNMTNEDSAGSFRKKINEGKTIGIISEAGCPGIADPGQELVALAQEMGIEVKPLVGPSSILLALMGSGMNGQQFQFNGYLPIKQPERNKAIKELEAESLKKKCTQIFIETPYRNNQLINDLLSSCQLNTKLCIAVDLTGVNEFIKTRSVSEWKKDKPDIHKRTAIFLLHSS